MQSTGALIEQLPIFEPLTQATRNELRPLDVRGPYDYLVVRSSVDREGHLLIRVDTWDGCEDDEAEGFTLTGKPVKRLAGRYVVTRWQQWMSAFPEQRLPPASLEYEIPVTDYSCLVIHCCWPRDRIVFQSEETRAEYLSCLLQFFSTNKRAKMVAEFKQEDVVPEMPEWYEEPEGTELSGYQKVAHQFGLCQPSSAWFMDRGTGKTICSVALVCSEARLTRQGLLSPINGEGHMMRTLIVVPKHLRLNWQREFIKFANTPGKVTIIRGGKRKRISLLTHAVKDDDECAFSAVIIPYDTVANDLDVLTLIPWDRIIVDESQYFKSPRSRRWKALQELRDCADRRLELTGSPIGNSYKDLYTQMEFGYKGNSGFGRYESFRSFHGKYNRKAAGHGVEKLEGLENVPLLQEKLARFAFAVTKDEAGLNLPDKIYDFYEVGMTKKQAEYYNQLCSQLAVEMEEGEAKGRMTADHILTRLLRLAQITSGFVTWEPVVDPHTGEVLSPKRVEQIDSIWENPKINAVVDMMRDKPDNEKTLIWSTSVEDILAIHERLQAEGFKGGTFYGGTSNADRIANEDAFNQDPEFKYLVLNPMTGGVGLNLLGYDVDNPDGPDTYCGHEIFFCCNWSSLLRDQAEDRAHRRGTKYPVRITDLVVPNTIDPEIRDRVMQKQEMAALIQDVSNILKSVLGINMNFNFAA